MTVRCALLLAFMLMVPTSAATARSPAQYFDKSYAVVVGIRDYKNPRRWPQLKNSENDAKEMEQLLKAQGFDVQPFLGTAATEQAITSYIEDTLAPKLGENDRVVFYFSGHGETARKGLTNWGYVIPYDATKDSSSWIAMDNLQMLARMMDAARHQLFIFDACFGGTFALKSSLSATPEDVPNYVEVVAREKARQFLTAGGPKDRTPAESNLKGYAKYSFFTAYLIKALREDAGDINKDGFITASELHVYLETSARSQYNTPRGGLFPGHGLGNFVLQASRVVEKRTPIAASDVLKGGVSPTPTTATQPSLSDLAPVAREQPRVKLRLQSAFSSRSAASNSSLERFQAFLSKASGGKVLVDALVSGAVVHSFQVVDATHDGVLEGAWTPAHLFSSARGTRIAFGAGPPFNGSVADRARWMEDHGEAYLAERLPRWHLNLVVLFCGAVPTKAQVVGPFGHTGFVSILPGGEIVPGLSGDEEPEPAEIESAELLVLAINKGFWEKLDESQRAILQLACGNNVREDVKLAREANRGRNPSSPQLDRAAQGALQSQRREAEALARKDKAFASLYESWKEISRR